jgi:hypothetical protein
MDKDASKYENKINLPPLKVMTPEEVQNAFNQQNKTTLSSYACDEITKITENIGSFTIGEKSTTKSKQKKSSKKLPNINN